MCCIFRLSLLQCSLHNTGSFVRSLVRIEIYRNLRVGDFVMLLVSLIGCYCR